MWIGLNWLTIGFGGGIFGHWDTRWRSWLRHCATSRKVAGSIPDDVIGFFIDLILSVAMWPWGRLLGSKGGQCLGLTTLPPSCTDCLESWKLQPPGTLGACPSLCTGTFTLVWTFGHYESSWNEFVVERRKNIKIWFIIFKTVHQVSVEVYMCVRNETQRKINLPLCTKYSLQWSAIFLTKFHTPSSVEPKTKRTFRAVAILFTFYNKFTIIDR
jgi:hypothetical protein